MKVYDCFTFYNEFELLELRLKSLWDAVDYFVVVEANRKHTGEPKTFNFWTRMEDFKDFLPKIRFVPADLSNVQFKGVGDWSIENAQRNAILNGIGDAEPDDLILISDLDEIPASDIIQRINANEAEMFFNLLINPPTVNTQTLYPAKLIVSALKYLEKSFVTLDQTLHFYYFDRISRSSWPGTILIGRKNLTTPQELRDVRRFAPFILNGGHHFSYMGGVDRVISKMTSIVEGKKFVVKSGGKFIDRAHVEAVMANGTDIYDRKDRPESQFIPFDAHNIKLPYIDEFLRKYPHFLREPEKYFAD